MTKKKGKKVAFEIKPWCWYCEKIVEDERVLLQHQKAKHFKCGQCPRKLNTAGGLMVHCQQVHKVEPDKLTNTLPGRDGYDVEIFGMEGIPAKDAEEWRIRKQREAGLALDFKHAGNGPMGGGDGRGQKRVKISHGVIPVEECRRLLEEHKRLMGVGKGGQGQNGVVGLGGPAVGPGGPGMLLPPAMHQGPYPPFGYPQGGMPSMGQPPFLPPGNFLPGSNPQMPFRPPFPMPLPNGMLPPPNMNGFPQPIMGPNGMMPPFMPPAGFRPPGMGMPGFPPAFPMPAPIQQKVPTEEEMKVMEPKDGTLWPDNDFSPAEKRAMQPRYRCPPSPVFPPSMPNFLPPPNGANFMPPPMPAAFSPYPIPTPLLAGASPAPSTPLVGSNVAPEPPADPVVPVIDESVAAAIPSSPIPAPGTTYATAVKDEVGDAIDPEPVPMKQEDIDGTFAHEVKAEKAEEGMDVGELKSEGLAVAPTTPAEATGSRKRKAAEDFMD